MRHWFSFILFSVLSVNVAANPDSLRVVWGNQELHDTVRLKAGLELADWFINEQGQIDSSDLYLAQVVEQAEELGDSLILAHALLKSGDNASWHSGEKSLELYERALRIFEEICSEKNQAIALASIGMTYYGLGDLNKTAEYGNRAIPIAEKYNDYDCLAFCYQIQAYVAEELGDPMAMKSAFEKCYSLIDSLSDETVISMTLDALSTVSVEMKEYRKGIQYFNELIERVAAPHPGNYSTASDCYKAIGDSALNANNQSLADEYYDQAIVYSDRSIEASKTAGNTNSWLGWAYVGQAQIHLARKQYKEALQKAKLAEGIARETGEIRLSWLSSRVLKKAYEALGNYKMALRYADQKAVLADSIAGKDQLKQAARTEIKFEFERKQLADSLAKVEADRVLLAEAERVQAAKNRRNNLQYSGIIILVLLLGMLIAYSGRINMGPSTAEGLIFVFFLLLFEFVLVVMDPFVDNWSGGEVAVKLAINSFFALLVFFGHRFFEGKLKTVLAERRVRITQSTQQSEE